VTGIQLEEETEDPAQVSNAGEALPPGCRTARYRDTRVVAFMMKAYGHNTLWPCPDSAVFSKLKAEL
jgi:hypothetical protein